MELKRYPTDFLVEEQPSRTFSREGNLFVYRATKYDLTTAEMVRRLARAAGLPDKAIKYAGLKDRRAITTQYLTSDAPLHSQEDIIVEAVGRASDHLTLGEHAGNRFRITLRGVRDTHDCAVPNYFGLQRFSSENVSLGLALLKKDYAQVADRLRPGDEPPLERLHQANRKLLILFVHAVQSWLFNNAVSAYIADTLDVVHERETPHGVLRYPKDLPELTVPMVGAAQDLGDWEKYYLPLLADAGIAPRDFLIRSLPFLTQEGTTRPLRLPLQAEQVSAGQDLAVAEILLAPGAYATVYCGARFS